MGEALLDQLGDLPGESTRPRSAPEACSIRSAAEKVDSAVCCRISDFDSKWE
jgi:hypothetical protein